MPASSLNQACWAVSDPRVQVTDLFASSKARCLQQPQTWFRSSACGPTTATWATPHATHRTDWPVRCHKHPDTRPDTRPPRLAGVMVSTLRSGPRSAACHSASNRPSAWSFDEPGQTVAPSTSNPDSAGGRSGRSHERHPGRARAAAHGKRGPIPVGSRSLRSHI